MLKQNCTIEQKITSSTNLDEEFENVESAVLAVFRLLKEYDRLVEIAETEIKKILDSVFLHKSLNTIASELS